MRTLEISLVAAIAGFVWWGALTGRPRRPVADLFGLLGVGGISAAQFLVEGYRWQMVPLYAAVGLVVIVSVWDLTSPADDDGDRRRSRRAALWGSLGLGLLVVPAVALPVVDLSEADRTPVGTLWHTVVDSGRIERYGPDPGRPREIALQIWYPAATVDGTDRAGLVDDVAALAPAAADYLGFPSFFLDHLRFVRTNSFEAAPSDTGRFPVVIYSHGWGGFRAVALNQMEALAAEGFVVVAIDHTHAALSTTLSDGEPRRIDVDALPARGAVPVDEYLMAWGSLSQTMAEDIGFVADHLQAVNEGGVAALAPVAGHLDLDRLGVMGHSTGGGAAIIACASDPRCDAVLGQDPWVEPVPDRLISTGLSMPTLALRSEQWLDRDNDASVARLLENSGNSAVGAFLRDTVHRDFTVLPAVSPFAALVGLSGSLDTQRTFDVLEAVNVAFFDEHLRDGPSFRRRLAGFSELVFDQ